MTFAIVTIAEKPERVVGTIWAEGELDAQQMATSLFQETPEMLPERLIVRRAEEREIPLRFMN